MSIFGNIRLYQGSRIKDQMVVYENALDFKKKVPSAPTLGPVKQKPQSISWCHNFQWENFSELAVNRFESIF